MGRKKKHLKFRRSSSQKNAVSAHIGRIWITHLAVMTTVSLALLSGPMFAFTMGSASEYLQPTLLPPVSLHQLGADLQGQGQPVINSAEKRPKGAGFVPAFPFLHLVSILLLGGLISSAQLAMKFRHFWGLGVFTNWYSALFLILGAGLCGGLPLTAKDTLIAHLGSLGSWTADVVGVAATVILPAIPLKTSGSHKSADNVRDLGNTPSPNYIVAFIEECIKDKIRIRMQAEITAASRQYSWDDIEMAARRTLEEAVTLDELQPKEKETALKSIDEFRRVDDPRMDSTNKYTALLDLMRLCSFSRLQNGLKAESRESK
jgi:hypothetical protein